MDKRILLLLALFSFVSVPTVFAQEDEGEETESSDNLVLNGGFENTRTKTLKNYGQLDDLCVGWESATEANADVFAMGVKGDKVAIPKNTFGSQEALNGECYAGFRAYSKDKKYSRTYLQIQLDDELEDNQQYCFKFNISLADLSKYAVNHIGVYVSDRKIEQPNTGTIAKEAQVKHKSNKVMMMTDGWETICGTFIADGNEEYIIIGCFGRNDELEIEKVKRPSGMTGVQTYHAYYYIDDVEVYPVDAKSQCQCSRFDEAEPDLIYSKSVVVNENMSATDVVKNSDVYYAFLKSDLNAIAKRDLANVVKILNENPQLKLEVVGHCDNDEFDEGKINPRYRDLGQKRAERVVEFLIAQGISEMRLVPRTKENTEPANTRPTPLSKAQNRRVVFVPR